jgi:type IV pilus secretin PilQ/predicted competence protein
MKYAQPLKIWWLIILISFVSVLQGCAAKAPATAKQQGPLVVINKIEPRDIDGKAEITIEGTGPIQQYTSFQLTDPLRLVVDISDADLGAFKDKISIKSGAMNDITPSQTDNIARLEIGLSQAVDTKVYQSDGKLMVEIAKPGEAVKTTEEAKPSAEATPAAETVAPAAPQEAPKQETAEAAPTAKATATVISKVNATAGKGGIKVVITADGTMNPHAFMVEKPTKKLVVDIPGVKSKVKQSVIPVRKGGLKTVRVGKHPDKVRVVLDLTKTLNYTVTPEGNSLIIAMGAAVAATPGEKPSQERAASQDSEKATAVEKEAATPQETTAVVPAQVNQDAAEKEAAQLKEAAAPVPLPAKKERASAGKPVLGSAETALLAGSSRYSGRRISLDLQDADLINVMRLFAEVANLNIILAPDVKGKVTVRMVNIPWDQAMDTILRMNGLGYALEDNILRIASVGALTKESEEESKSKEAKKKAEDLITRIVPINYATASGIEGTIKKSLSPRGETVVDVRTNTLIIKDIARNVDEVVSLIRVLDKPIAQIMIEARIVEASLTFSRQIGVQWGGNFQADAAHGNPTGLSFPNSIGVTGSSALGATTSGNGNFLVNMPAAVGQGSGGAIGFQFGSISKALNLDLVLSALESTGEGKVISQPKISALDNKEAKIEQGLSIPYSTTSSSGTQIQFIDAKLALTVTPHATPDNKIFLKITATKNAPDTSILGASGQPSIRKNEATTEILLADGETAVIGGILTVNKTVNYTKVPFFGDLPLIGWLFKNESKTDTRGELLIFITPRVVKQEVI